MPPTPTGAACLPPLASPLAPLLTAADVARLLQVSKKLIYQHATAGSLPCLRIGTAVRFREADVVGWLEQARRGAAQPSSAAPATILPHDWSASRTRRPTVPPPPPPPRRR